MFRTATRLPLRCPRTCPVRSFATNNAKPKSRILLKVTGGLVATGAGLYLASEDVRSSVRHVVLTAERVNVVAVATMRCFKIYRDVLLEQYADDLERNKALAAAHQKAANITLKALEKNGGIYIKLGQHVSALTYLLPPEWTNTMTPLQDRCPRSSLEEIERMFEHDMGVKLLDKFSEFNPQPVGVASLAQVHIARLRDTGEKVAVKVQHPSLAEFVPLDVFLTQTVFGLMHKAFPEYPMTWLGDELSNSIFVELNFKIEAENAQKTASNFERLLHSTALRVPAIVSAEKRILIMEYVAGARLDDLQYMKDHHINTAEVSSCLSHIFNNMIFTPNVGLHCDPHAGNLAIRAVDKKHSGNGHNFEIVLYDHGLYRYIPLEMKRNYAHFWLAILDNDLPKMKEYAQKVAGVEGDRKFRVFISAITGRDPESAMNYDISKPRSDEEIAIMQSHLQHEEGVLEDLMYILSNVPRMVLLILKTNDLTRNLDEHLNNPLGPERTFLIMANYCAKVVYLEKLEINSKKYRKYSFGWLVHNLGAWLSYHRALSSLYLYDLAMLFHNLRHGFQ